MWKLRIIPKVGEAQDFESVSFKIGSYTEYDRGYGTIVQTVEASQGVIEKPGTIRHIGTLTLRKLASSENGLIAEGTGIEHQYTESDKLTHTKGFGPQIWEFEFVPIETEPTT